jgi:endonuclease/exonuclease/phosphatase family metal-dependent hydrolase
MPKREERIAFEVKVKVEGRDLSFVTTHLHHLEASLREQQAAKLNEVFGADRPIVLAGDLNATPQSKPIVSLKEKWTIATADSGLLTYPSAKPVKQIDYVLFRPAGRFRVVEAGVIDERVASDHRPVLVVLASNED